MGRIQQALTALSRALIDAGKGRDGGLPDDLSFGLDLSSAPMEEWRRRAKHLYDTLHQRIEAGASSWVDGTVWDFQSGDPESPHRRPPSDRHTFAGYTATGKPTWVPFVDLCLELRPPGLDSLFTTKPGVVVISQTDEALGEARLDGFGDGGQTFRILGQVVAGLLPLDLSREDGDRGVLTVQIVARTDTDGVLRVHLNHLGISARAIHFGAASGPPRNPAEQLRRTLRQSQKRLDGIARKSGMDSPGALEVAVSPVLARLRSDVARIFAGDRGRTAHAKTRHQSGQRPTSVARSEAENATDERILTDERRATYVVLGRKGRAHVFAGDGRHVTSLRLEPGEVERKTRRKRWRPATTEELAELRQGLQRFAASGRDR